MFPNETSLTSLSLWARGSGLEIALFVTGTILLTRLATWAGARTTDRIDANARETDTLDRSEASKRGHAGGAARASPCQPTWRRLSRPSRPRPPDAAGADLDLDPDRAVPHHR